MLGRGIPQVQCNFIIFTTSKLIKKRVSGIYEQITFRFVYLKLATLSITVELGALKPIVFEGKFELTRSILLLLLSRLVLDRSIILLSLDR